MYKLSIHGRDVSYDPTTCRFSVRVNEEDWEWCSIPYIALSDGAELPFNDAKCSHRAVDAGIEEGVRAEYRFALAGDSVITAVTHLMVEKATGRVSFRIQIEGDAPLQIKEVRYPGPISLDAEKDNGYTVYPAGQGVLVPAKHPKAINGVGRGIMFSRSSLMPFFGQVRNGTGFCAIYETPYDAKHCLRHAADGDTSVQPIFVPSMGRMRYQREMVYDFLERCDHVATAKHYRDYVKGKGRLRTLAEKAHLTPKVKKLRGVVALRQKAKIHVKKESKHYDHKNPANNDKIVTFDEMAESLKRVHKNGLRNVQFCLEGWCAHGYDNRHPDPFPITPEAGGEAGLLRLRDTCESLGYLFEVHDQVRDYYHDAATFSFDNAVLNPDGTHPYCDTWHGGAHTWLCAQFAPAYTRRNFQIFQDMGARLDGYYSDCLSISMLDECVNPDHPLSREGCAWKRRECFDQLNARNVLTSSEGAIDCLIESIHLGASFHFPQRDSDEPDERNLILPTLPTIPLFNLVYHDCLVSIWRSTMTPDPSCLLVPGEDTFFLHAVLNGNIMWVEPEQYDDLELIEAMGAYQKVHARIALQEMTHHEFVDGDVRRQRTRFADGTTIEVDFDARTYSVEYSDP